MWHRYIDTYFGRGGTLYSLTLLLFECIGMSSYQGGASSSSNYYYEYEESCYHYHITLHCNSDTFSWWIWLSITKFGSPIRSGMFMLRATSKSVIYFYSTLLYRLQLHATASSVLYWLVCSSLIVHISSGVVVVIMLVLPVPVLVLVLPVFVVVIHVSVGVVEILPVLVVLQVLVVQILVVGVVEILVVLPVLVVQILVVGEVGVIIITAMLAYPWKVTICTACFIRYRVNMTFWSHLPSPLMQWMPHL